MSLLAEVGVARAGPHDWVLQLLLLTPECVMPSLLPCSCKRLAAERDEARAEGFAEAALAVEQGLEIDRLRKC